MAKIDDLKPEELSELLELWERVHEIGKKYFANYDSASDEDLNRVAEEYYSANQVYFNKLRELELLPEHLPASIRNRYRNRKTKS
ncbi:MAG: hypothetical protein ACYC56_08230 [Candidatus Aquicultor sp.]